MLFPACDSGAALRIAVVSLPNYDLVGYPVLATLVWLVRRGVSYGGAPRFLYA